MSIGATPVQSSERHAILDVLRGIALLGICLANYPEFSLYTFQPEGVTAAMPTAGIDRAWRYFHYTFIDGKFYSLFSLLFGIGFSIIITNLTRKCHNGYAVFYRRMFLLALIGLLHLLLLWAGDILILYALTGMLLPLFAKLPNRWLLVLAATLIAAPVAMDAFREYTGGRFSAVIPLQRAVNHFNAQSGITSGNFPVWLLEGKSYIDILRFNLSGAFIRCIEFVEGNRIPKVLGLFLLGLCVGRSSIYAHLDSHVALLRRVRTWGFVLGLPLSAMLAWSEMNGRPLGLTAHSAIYALGVVPMSLACTAAVCLWYIRRREARIFRILAAPGRMALTAYISQSAAGIIIFYGVGFGLAIMGLVYVEMIAAAVFILQMACSTLWLKHFRYGPLEWIWRMLTYGKRLRILNKA